MNPFVKKWAKRVYTFPELIKFECRRRRFCLRGASISNSAKISKIELHGNAVNLSIGNYSSVGRCYIQCHAPVEIGRCVVINDGVRILAGSHDIDAEDYAHVFKPIVIEDYAWVASGAFLLQGVTIGRGAVVAAGAVVSRSIAPFEVVGGNPAKLIKMRAEKEFSYLPSTWFAHVEAWKGINKHH